MSKSFIYINHIHNIVVGMSYKDNIEDAQFFSRYQKDTDKIPYLGDGRIFQKMRKNVYFARSYRTKPERIWTIREVMEKWGVLNKYNELIAQMVRKVENHPDELAVVEWLGNDDNLVPNPEEQKMFNWGIFDAESGRTLIYGGVVFQYGEMSFHT